MTGFSRAVPECHAADGRAAPKWHGIAERALSIAAAIAALSSGLFLAQHHPLWPTAASVAFAFWTIVAARWRGLWLFVVPSALPALNFSPCTGWLAFDEFDLLVLGALAGGFARHFRELAKANGAACESRASGAARAGAFLALALAGLSVFSLVRGLIDSDVWSFGWVDSYIDTLNSVRVSKTLMYVSALWPLLRAEFQRSSARAIRRLTLGMQFGLAFVGAAVLLERAVYPGLLDFSTPYRTTATFWEMHIGGAAIDAYLALATPFVVWALWSTHSPWSWALAALLALLTAHTALTTFSRGTYAATTLPLALLGSAWWLRRFRIEPRDAVLTATSSIALAVGTTVLLIAAFLVTGYAGVAATVLGLLVLILTVGLTVRALDWRRAAAMALTVALLTEAVAALVGGTFMRSRFDASESDFGARLAHWRSGVFLLANPGDWLLGIGAGRLPTRYAREVPQGEFSGTAALVDFPSGGHAVRLSGPATVSEYAGLFALTQQVTLQRMSSYRVGFRVRVTSPTTIAVNLCEQHLLYPRNCQEALVRVTPDHGRWRSILISLEGPELDAGTWYARRPGVFSASILQASRTAELTAMTLTSLAGVELLANGDFSAGFAHWFPLAKSHFLPWHIDNLYLELLIERGALGLAGFLLLVGFAFRNLFALWKRGVLIAPFLASSLFGTLLVGCVGSILDVPRVSFLLLLIAFTSLQVTKAAAPTDGSDTRLETI